MKRRPAEETTVLVRITQPAHTTPHYTWDGARERPRFAGLAPGMPHIAGDLGVVVSAPDVPVLMLGLGDVSLAPETLVACHILRGARDAMGRLALIACIEGMNVDDTLTDGVITASLIAGAGLAVPLQWLNAIAAQDALREAQAAARRAAHEQTRTSAPAWRVPAGVDISRAAIDGLGIFDAAPALLEYIPYRFQQYLTQHLLDDERVLFFAERPEAEARGQRWLSRRAPVLAGLLLVTDRRILLLEDRAPPNLMLVQGSYQIAVAGLGRLAGVELRPAALPDYHTMWIALAARDGRAEYIFDLPDASAPAGQIAVDLLRAFLPRATGAADRRVRRVLESVAPFSSISLRDEQTYIEQLIPDNTRAALERAVAATLGGQRAVAQAYAPAVTGVGAQAVALTADALYLVTTYEAARRIALAAVAGATYTYSLMACDLTLLIPQGTQAERMRISFPHIASALYGWVFTALGLALHTPYPAQMENDHA
jgi:hypothetical protein